MFLYLSDSSNTPVKQWNRQESFRLRGTTRSNVCMERKGIEITMLEKTFSHSYIKQSKILYLKNVFLLFKLWTFCQLSLSCFGNRNSSLMGHV